MQIDRKVWAGGLSGVAAWALLAGAKSWLGLDLCGFAQPVVDFLSIPLGLSPSATSCEGLLALGIGYGVSYFLPPAERDIYDRLNAELVAKAITDEKHPLTSTGVAEVMHHDSQGNGQ